jgi:hypothetical protein
VGSIGIEIDSPGTAVDVCWRSRTTRRESGGSGGQSSLEPASDLLNSGFNGYKAGAFSEKDIAALPVGRSCRLPCRARSGKAPRDEERR